MQNHRKLLYPVLTLCFLLGMLGFFLGRRSAGALTLTTQRPAATEAPGRSLPVERAEPARSDGERIDLNRATQEELMTLPGIGEVLAQRIIDYREANGPFRQAAELMNVSGVGEGIFTKLRDYVYVEEQHEGTDH